MCVLSALSLASVGSTNILSDKARFEVVPVKRKDGNPSFFGELEIKATSEFQSNDIDAAVVGLCLLLRLKTILFIFDEQALSLSVLELV